MADLIQRVKTTRFNLKRAMRMVSPNTSIGEAPNIFREAIRRQVCDSLWSDPRVEFVQQDAPTFPIQTRNASAFTKVAMSHGENGQKALARLYEERRKKSDGKYQRPNPERRWPIIFYALEINKNTNDIFVSRHERVPGPGDKYFIRLHTRDNVPLLFQYDDKFVFANLQYYDPKDPKAQSPIKGFERARLNLQRVLGRYVHYWAIVNKDFLKFVDFRELGEFTRLNGNTFVTIDVTLEDEDLFLGAWKEKYKLRKAPSKRRKTASLVTTPSLETREIFSQYSQKPQSAFEETLRH